MILNNVKFDPAVTGLDPSTRMLYLIHKKTRSVCSSRFQEWRGGIRYRFREPDTMDGRRLMLECAMPALAVWPPRDIRLG